MQWFTRLLADFDRRLGKCMNETLVERLRKRAEIRRNISTRKSVQNGEKDRLADLLDEAAKEIEYLHNVLQVFNR